MAVALKRIRLSNPSIRRSKKAGAKYFKAYGSPHSRGSQGFGAKGRPTSGTRGYQKKKNPSKMSLAQKLHFGTARQRAAARLSLRNPSRRKTKKTPPKGGARRGLAYLYGPKGVGRKRLKTRAKRRRKNVGEIVSISLAGLGNPGKTRRSNGMATRRKRRNSGTRAGRSWSTYTAKRRKKNPGTTHRRRRRSVVAAAPRRRRISHRRRNSGMARRRRRNPVYAMRRINRGRRRSNPGLGGMTSGTIGKALGVIGGMLGSKYLTQLALGGNNTGYVGYVGNLAASIGLGWAAGKVTKSKEFGTMVMVGGIGALLLRVLSDMTPIGQYVNLSLAGMRKGGDLSLGIIQDSSFPVPQTFMPGSMTQAVVPTATRAYVGSQMAQAAQMKSAGSGGMGYMQGGRKVRRAIM